ncbi:MAG: hypothetical protein WC889_10495, partial [Myxococcota bacterium]
MNTTIRMFFASLVPVVLCMGPAGCQTSGSNPADGGRPGDITARMLVQPEALAGPGPDNLNWSPQGAQLAYTLAGESGYVLWLYDASTGVRRVLLDPADRPGGIDVTTAQWSPAGDAMLLAGDTSLWLLDTASGGLKPVAGGGGAIDAMMFAPSGTQVS